MPPPPLELTGWIDFIIWGAVLLIVVIIAIVLAEYMFKWLRGLQSTQARLQSTSINSYENKGYEELLQEIRALRKEIRELMQELKE